MDKGPESIEPIKLLDKVLQGVQQREIFCVEKIHDSRRDLLKAKNVKKDALWKPLFRKFRRFVQDTVYKQVHSHEIDNYPMEFRQKLYTRLLDVPQELGSQTRNQFALVLLIETKKITKNRGIA